MLESEKLAIAAHLHVLLRRKIGRVTDVEWIVKNHEYAREVIRVARAETAHIELLEWAQKLDDALFNSPEKPRRPDAGDSGFVDSRTGTPRPPKPDAPRYVGSLR